MRIATAPRFLTRPAIWPLSHGEFSFADDLVWEDWRGRRVIEGGRRFNGASIPRWLWWLIGHPMTPEFVYPAGMHDADCEDQTESPEVVHERFYVALWAEGVKPVKRHAMAAAVEWRGPKW